MPHITLIAAMRCFVASKLGDEVEIPNHLLDKRTIYEWSPELKGAVELAKAARPKRSPLLFCTRQAKPYINEALGRAPGWKSIWQRYMKRIITETKIKETFTEHDLRAKVASDAHSLEHARALLAHSDARTTDRIYRRKAERVPTLKA